MAVPKGGIESLTRVEFSHFEKIVNVGARESIQITTKLSVSKDSRMGQYRLP